MSSAASFTGPNSVRYPAPDVARGFMLLLIAVANVPIWLMFFPEAPETSAADDWWVLIRGLLVDHRAYPLFSILFGFGLMTMIIRRTRNHVGARTAELALKMPDLPQETREQWIAGFEAEAADDARRLVRRRGYWMLLFGLIHGLVFFGDIIGTYAVVAIVFAGVIARKNFKAMAIISAVQIALMLVFMVGAQILAQGFSAFTAASAAGSLNMILDWYFPLASFGQWLIATIMTPIFATVVPCAFLGARIATTDLMKSPEKHRGLLIGLGIGGLLLTSLLGAPQALFDAHMLSTWIPGASAVHELSGVFGAIGWLSLLALFAGPARESLTGVRLFLSTIGKRSMTAYIGQTILFALVFAIMGLSGVRGVPPLQGLAIAVAVWAVLAVFCRLLEARGYKRGPLEVLLRTAVAKSAGDHPLPEIPTWSPAAATALQADAPAGAGELRESGAPSAAQENAPEEPKGE